MPEVVCNTSPLQYLHQIGQLRILPALAGSIIDLNWIQIRAPISVKAASLIADLGPGESQVLMLALETPGSIALLDDGLARRVAIARGIPIKGTLDCF